MVGCRGLVGRRGRMNDYRDLPAYTVWEVAHYLTVPAATIRYWSVGRDASAEAETHS